MIRKRQPKQELQQESKQEPKPKIKTVKPQNKPYEFKTWREEACFVLDLLEKQGINIYEEGRYGGMYLNQNKGEKFKKLFDREDGKKSKANQQINNEDKSSISNSDLSKLFGLK